jgi:RNA polymerase sigma-70 factor (ECF subfamily)
LESLEINIISEFRKGNVKVFEQIYQQNAASLLTFANSMVGDFDAAKDIVHDVFVTIWEKRSFLTINTSLKAYLYKCVRNACFDHFKHQKVIDKFQDHSKVELVEREIGYLSSIGEYSEEVLFEKRLEEVKRVIELLPEQCKKIFKLSRFEGLKNKEIALQLGISVRSVDTQIYRALKTLRDNCIDYLTVTLGLVLKWYLIR